MVNKMTAQSSPWMKRPGVKQVWLPSRPGKNVMGKDSYANVVKDGYAIQVNIPTIKVHSVGNGWLYRSVVATFADHRSTEFMFESLTKDAMGNFMVRRMGNKKILITFASESEMRWFIDKHNNQRLYWFTTVEPWSVRVAEEQVVFICNSDFSCHEKEYEQSQSSLRVEEDDNVDRDEAIRSLGVGSADSISFIEETQKARNGHGVGNCCLQILGGEESNRKDTTTEVLRAPLIGNQIHAKAGLDSSVAPGSGLVQGVNHDSGPGPLGPVSFPFEVVLGVSRVNIVGEPLGKFTSDTHMDLIQDRWISAPTGMEISELNGHLLQNLLIGADKNHLVDENAGSAQVGANGTQHTTEAPTGMEISDRRISAPTGMVISELNGHLLKNPLIAADKDHLVDENAGSAQVGGNGTQHITEASSMPDFREDGRQRKRGRPRKNKPVALAVLFLQEAVLDGSQIWLPFLKWRFV
ncbi:hypothetical protein Dimus_018951 [Dionaea muscipula]